MNVVTPVSQSTSHQPTRGLALFFCLLLCLLFLPARKQLAAVEPAWQKQSSGVLAKLNAVFFTDREHGWAAGSNGTLLATNDGGTHWQPLPLPGRTRKEPVLDLWAFAPDQVCLLGEYGLFNRSGEVAWHERVFVLRSEDRGASWLEARTAPPPLQPGQSIIIKQINKDTAKIEEPKPPPEPVLVRFAFVNARIGWAVGELGTIQFTRDGGQSWQLQFTQLRKLFNDVSALNEQQAWIVGGGGTILQTGDGGQSWEPQTAGNSANLLAVHFADAKHGWAAGNNGTMLATTNGGLRWQTQTTGTTRTLYDVFFVNTREGWAAGERGTLLHTTDGGATWQDNSLETHANLHRLFFLSPDCGWAVGGNGALFKYE